VAKQIRGEDGRVTRLEFSAAEMASKILDVPLNRLLRWSDIIPPSKGQGAEGVYSVKSKKSLELIKKRAALLKTGMNTTAVKNVEANKLLDAYAALCSDCPEGITAHVWRSYGLVVLMQVRYGKMIGAEELAKRAGINKEVDGKMIPDLDMAAKHIRLLNSVGYLEQDDSDEWRGQWRHRGLPEAWTGKSE